MDENLKNSKKLLHLLIKRTQHVDFACDNLCQGITVSFYKKMLSSAKAVLHLYKDYYNACIIASHMLEGLIWLKWMLDKPRERVHQYTDFGIIEALGGLHIHPEEKENVLKCIKENNLERFLKKNIQKQELTDEILLNPENYCSKWYRLEAKDIKDIVNQLTNGGHHQDIINIKHLYNRLCAYKHYSPYVMLSRYGEKTALETSDDFIAISTVLESLYLTLLLVNQYQNDKIDISDISQKYQIIIKQLQKDYMPVS